MRRFHTKPQHLAAVLTAVAALPALAQPKPPAVPSAPAIPSAPAVPSAPAPAGKPAPEAKAGPDGAPPAGSTGGPAVSPPANADYVLYERSKKKDEGETSLGVPPTLPTELKRNVKPGMQVQDSKKLLTIEDLTNAPVVSASNRQENLRSAPAFVIVLSEKELLARGYTELSQMLDDLPGMDMIRPNGDIYFKSYWRGYRPGGGADPYLVMVDGLVFNHLFFRDGQILASIPMSNIERVEVVYGPASAVYGPNAAMGIIHVITKDHKKRQENGEYGTWFQSRITGGGPQANLSAWRDITRQVDATLTHITKDYRLRLTARAEDSVFDRSAGDYYEYTKPKYYRDARLWPSSLQRNFPDMAGSFHSPDHKRGLDGRLFVGSAEVGVQYYSLSTGLGTRYPGDRQQNSPPWTTEELSFFGRHNATLSGSATLTSMIQYRQSNLARPSLSLFSTPDGPGLLAVEVPSSAIVVQEDLSVLARRNLLLKDDALTVNLGLKYQHFQLTPSYQTTSSVVFPTAAADPVTGAVDTGTSADTVSVIRKPKAAEELGAYALAKYAFPAQNALHLGVRYDKNTLVNVSDFTFRGGYAGTFGPVTAKALYGQAVYSPSPFDLASVPLDRRDSLGVERSSTLEANVSFTMGNFSVTGDLYKVSYTNPVITDDTLIARDVAGFDIGATALLQPVLIWAYYSRYLQTKEQRTFPTDGIIGDLSMNKVWGGVTLDYAPLTATVLGRWMGARDTVYSNPIRRVPAYFTLDANVMLSRLGHDGLWTAVRVANLLGSRYGHPGMERADAGVDPAVFSNGTYRGSAGSANSVHPQPGRSIYLTLGLDL